jgi:thiol:disulfide interchange protein DsbD
MFFRADSARLLAPVVCGLIALAAEAQVSTNPFGSLGTDKASGANVEVELIADTTHLVPGKVHRLGLVLTMREGWHTYWQNPGDSGIATTIELDLPEGLRAGSIRWPAPERHIAGDGMIVDYVYHDTVVLQIPLFVDGSVEFGQRITIDATIDWLECKDVCIPGQTDVQLTLPVSNSGSAAAPEVARLFGASDSRMPVPASKARALRTKWKSNTLEIRSSGAERMTFFPLAPSFPAPEDLATSGSVEGDSMTLVYPDSLPAGSTVRFLVEVEGGPDEGRYDVIVGTDPRLKGTPVQSTPEKNKPESSSNKE